jgi:hypothetical protein
MVRRENRLRRGEDKQHRQFSGRPAFRSRALRRLLTFVKSVTILAMHLARIIIHFTG